MTHSPPPTIPPRFAGLPDELADYRRARAVVVPLPYDATTSYRTGTRAGPAAILEASAAMELFDEQLLAEPCQVGIATLEALDTDARGPEHQLDAVRRYLLPVASDGKFFVALGGEHSLSLGCIDALLEASPGPMSVLQIDAHADLRDSYQNSPLSHACVMRRALERCPVVQVGIRSLSAGEHAFIRAEGLEPFWMSTIRQTPDWIEQVAARLSDRVYLTIDLDGLDPGICPGVGTPEPGGLGWVELLELLRAVFARREVLAADVVECLPLPGQQVTEFLAARLVYKLIGYRFAAELE